MSTKEHPRGRMQAVEGSKGFQSHLLQLFSLSCKQSHLLQLFSIVLIGLQDMVSWLTLLCGLFVCVRIHKGSGLSCSSEKDTWLFCPLSYVLDKDPFLSSVDLVSNYRLRYLSLSLLLLLLLHTAT